MKLPDARSLSPESLELLRSIAIRAVEELGMLQKEVAQLLDVSEPTIGKWCKAYREHGEESILVKPQGKPEGVGRSLTPLQEEEIQKIIQEDAPEDHGIASSAWTRGAVVELIRQRWGVELTPEGVGKYLRRWNMTPQKPTRRAREQDPDEVQEFLEETLPDAVKRAEQEDGELHFADEVGTQVDDQIGRTYAPRGQTPVLDVPKTRIQQNVISSVTPEGELHYWLFPETMNAEKFIQFLEILIDSNSRKVFLFVDHHRSHEANAVERWLDAHSSQIEIVWLPRYSPELNPDELLNNDLKQRLKNEPLPKDASRFRDLIDRILASIASLPDRIRSYFQQVEFDLSTR